MSQSSPLLYPARCLKNPDDGHSSLFRGARLRTGPQCPRTRDGRRNQRSLRQQPVAARLPGPGHRRGDRRRTTAPRTDRPSPDQDRGPSDRVDGTEAAARPRLTEVAPQTEPPILERRRHTRSRPKRAAGNVSGSPSCAGRAGNARFYRLDRRIPGHPDWLAEGAGFEPSLWRQNLPRFCATALLPLCRSEAQLNPDEKGR